MYYVVTYILAESKSDTKFYDNDKALSAYGSWWK